ncbi:MAG: RNA polymerase sigma factor [Pseudonocardia sp.]
MSTPTLIRSTETTTSASTAPPAPTGPTSTDIPPASPGPADLLRRAAAGHADAWAAIVARYTPMLRGRVRRYRLQDADAHDVIQVTWLRLAQNLDRIHTPAHLAGWLAAVANHECLRVLHEAKRTVVTAEAGYAATDPDTGPEQLAVDALTRAEVRATVGRAVATLPPRRRALVLALFADDGRSYARISRDFGIPVGSIGPTRARVLAQLRRQLNAAR